MAGAIHATSGRVPSRVASMKLVHGLDVLQLAVASHRVEEGQRVPGGGRRVGRRSRGASEMGRVVAYGFGSLPDVVPPLDSRPVQEERQIGPGEIRCSRWSSTRRRRGESSPGDLLYCDNSRPPRVANIPQTIRRPSERCDERLDAATGSNIRSCKTKFSRTPNSSGSPETSW